MVWRVCERLNINIPGILKDFNSNTEWQKAQLLAYESIREIECQDSELL